MMTRGGHVRVRYVGAAAIAFVSVLHCCCVVRAAEFSLGDATTVEMVDARKSAELLIKDDAFVAALSPFDRQARLKSGKETSQRQYLDFVAAQTLDWTDAERTKIEQVLGEMRRKLAPWKLRLPAVVQLVKTTGREEGQAAYCCGAAIVLPAGKLRADAKSLEPLLTHELFHVFSSHRPKLQAKLYPIVGFQPCDSIELTEELARRKITNPDAPQINCVMDVSEPGGPRHVAPVLLADRERYDEARGGEFFRYMQFQLLAVEKSEGKWRPALDGGKPILLEPRDVPKFARNVGGNTGYVIHPEEILADNFVLLVAGRRDVSTPRILQEMAKVLAEDGQETPHAAGRPQATREPPGPCKAR